MTQPFLKRIFLKAGWAPFAVLVIFQGIHYFGLRGAPGMDATIHFLGGASMGFFFHQMLPLSESFIGSLTKIGTAIHLPRYDRCALLGIRGIRF